MVIYLFFVSIFFKNVFSSVNCTFLAVFLHFFCLKNTDFNGDLFNSKNTSKIDKIPFPSSAFCLGLGEVLVDPEIQEV